MYKLCLIIDNILILIFFICMIYNFFVGIHNHDVYYLILGIIDYIILKLKYIKDYVDKIDNI